METEVSLPLMLRYFFLVFTPIQNTLKNRCLQLVLWDVSELPLLLGHVPVLPVAQCLAVPSQL